MKKTAISIAMLGILYTSQQLYASEIYTYKPVAYRTVPPLTKVLEKLSKTTKTDFFYSVSDLEDIIVDDQNIDYTSLRNTLNYLQSNYPVEFTVQNNTVSVRRASGKTKQITRTEADHPSKNDTIANKEKKIEEVVLVGYGKQNKKDISGSIASLGEKDLKNVASGNFGDMIAGKATGLQVTSANASPGSSPNIRIRGIGTLTAGANPLIVVDGFPLTEGINLNSIDPNSIASIDVLKDAASTAIYGSRGANGVILIQTKEGKKGKLEVILDSYYGIQARSDNEKFVNAYDMAIFMKESRDQNYLSKGTGRSISDDTTTRISKGATLRELIPDYLTPYLNKQPGLTDTNWYSAVLKPAPMSNTSLNILGGNEKTKYSFTGSYLNQKGILIGTDYEKYSGNINLTTNITDELRFGVSMTPSISSGSLFDMVNGGRTYNLLQMATTMYPFFAPRDSNGNLIISQQIRINGPTDGALVENPVAIAEMTKRKYTLFKTFGNIFAEWNFLKDFKYKISAGGDYTNYEYNFFKPSTVGSYRTPADKDVTSASRTEYITKNYLIENLLTYDKKIDNHSFNAILGQSYQNERSNQTATLATGFPDNSIENISGGTSFKIDVDQYKWTLISYFTRFSYVYNSKYSLMASYRRDGSSRFGAHSKWGNFYALSLGWTVSKEQFFSPNKWLDPLKLRFSLGTNGNNQIPNFGSLSLMEKENYVFGGIMIPGYRSSTATSFDLSWEKSKSVNFGIDFGLFNKYLNVSADYYILNRNGLLLDVPVPQQSGYSTLLQNIGKIRNSGLEIQLSLKPVQLGNNFDYSGNFSFSTNKNKVLALANGQSEIVAGANNFAVTRVGGSIAEMYGYNILGVYKTQDQIDHSPHIAGTQIGDYIMEDLNGDGKIDAADKKSFGSGIPKYIMGFTNTFRYKNFDLSFTLYSELAKKIYNGDQVNTTESGEGFGMATQHYFDNRYNPVTHPDGIYAMPNMNFSNNRKEARTSSIFFKNGDYVRLRSIRLAYNLPQDLVSALKLKSIQLYFVGNNLLTITSYKGQNLDATSESILTQGYDNGYYPVAKVYSFGMNMKF
ncbi:MAG: SusC/RagA family TonB-linked outer membrane protein [Chryseobacterium sp.]|jgi:TonB-linked SusC/RagA family outer membrane protein|uniref:SusC/RagA family TonB-linked outer membrane protein n=1 Tax=Chryseobacterium sp. TaxID=1871047 RepID=UPI0028261B5C|nr:SusC/RagA family TonB-linked outer membrane protein [Chryseobacterium sp.]MDR2238098.1 SusC/RagA family TonB-linked outer membrane protein [Chryseobacterium sp.]